MPAFRRVGSWPSPARLAEQMESGTIVALLADGGWKYLSEDVWSRDLDDESVEALNLW